MKKTLASIVLFMTSCSYGSTSSSEVNSFVRNFNKSFPKQHNLTFGGVGLSYPDEKLLKIDLTYSACYPADINQARVLIVQLMETTLKQINSDPKLNKVLSSFPFTVNEVIVKISFMDANGDFLNTDSKSLALVSVIKGKVYFSVNDNPYTFTDVLVEPYAEAYEKVMGRKL